MTSSLSKSPTRAARVAISKSQRSHFARCDEQNKIKNKRSTVPSGEGNSPGAISKTLKERRMWDFEQTMQIFKFCATSLSIPHPEKLHKHGEDASVVSSRNIAIFDGVGKSNPDAADPGEYSKRLAQLTQRVFESDPSAKPKDIAEFAVWKNSVPGSSTLSIVGLRNNHIEGINVGDSGFIVIRNGVVVFDTEATSHFFNCPHQVSFSRAEDLEIAQPLWFKIEEGDIIVAGSDGLWDNVFLEDIVSATSKHMESLYTALLDQQDKFESLSGYSQRYKSTEVFEKFLRSHHVHQDGNESRMGAVLEEIAFTLGILACRTATSRTGASPFAVKSMKENISHQGGKLDDITIAVAIVANSEFSSINWISTIESEYPYHGDYYFA